MNGKHVVIAVVGGCALLASQFSFAIGDAAKSLQDQWATAKYQTEDKAREKAFKSLSEQADKMAAQNPKDAEVLTWQAIILSTYAGEKGGFGALGLVKDAKKLLERAIEIDGAVLNGSAYTSLGSLYYQVPGWPVGFGDDDKAEALLKRGLQYAPDDIDANFFWGDFLLQDNRYQEAVVAFEKALNAPARPGREIADQGRKEEIKTKLAEARKAL